MAYIRCESCGAKALPAASRCPTCKAEFHLVDARGQRMRLLQCRGCGIMHRPDRACHWCPPTMRRPWPSPMVRQAAAASLLLAVVATSVWRYGDGAVGALARVLQRGEPGAPVAEPGRAEPVAAPAIANATPPAATPVAAEPGLPSPAGVTDPVDSASTWTPAFARTWVNVRSDARRDGSVVGIIKPSERALLGEGRGRWRQVKLPDAEGWVDGRLFAPDSTDGRGA